MSTFHGLECAVTLWEHQQKAALEAASRDSYGFFFEVGTGKTAAAITAMRLRFRAENRVLRTMIFGPPVVLKNWEAELKLHLPKSLHRYIKVVYGTGVERVKQLAEVERMKHEGFIVITNYQSLLMGPVCPKLTDVEPELLIFDEVHRLKNKGASTTKRAIKLADRARIKFGLTGTLMTNSPMDVWAQYRVLDGGETFGKNFFTFRSKYFFDKNAGMPRDRYFPDWRIRSGSLEAFNELITKTGLIAKKKDCLDLPPLVKETVAVEMSREQAKAYREMKNLLVATFEKEDQVAIAEFAMTKTLRLQQIVSGFVKLDSGDIKHFKNPRKEALRDLLEDLSPQSKIIVWAVFHENYEDVRDVCKSLKLPYVELHGEVVGENRFQAIDAFNEDPKVRVLIGHPGSGGIGVNLIASDVSIYYSRGFSLEQDIQSEARNYRGGSERHKKVTRIDLIAPGTVDEEVVKKLYQKQAISDEILKAMIT